MPAVKVTVNVEIDGEPLKGFPIVRRFEPTDKSSFDRSLTTGAPFNALPQSLTTIQFLLAQPAANMAFRINGAVGSEFTLNKGGILLIVDAAGFTGTTVQNNSGGTAKLVGATLGT